LAHPPDEVLMRRVRDGDLAQLETLWLRHAPAVHRYCARIASTEAADDLVQDVFLRVLRYRATWRGDGSFLGWLLRIARNTCHDHIESRRREENAMSIWRPDETAAEADPRLHLLQQALARLPEDRREVITLARWHDLPAERIAEVLGCSPGAVRVRLHRALRELRDILHAMEDPTP
jgi:RNA polymerase sigma-70 factor (ECF subfamily)